LFSARCISSLDGYASNSDLLKSLNEYKAVLSIIFKDRNLCKKFKDWLLQSQHIQQATFNRCTDFNSLLLELEKQNLLGIFVSYTDYPSKDDITKIKKSYDLIPMSPCTKCNKSYFLINWFSFSIPWRILFFNMKFYDFMNGKLF